MSTDKEFLKQLKIEKLKCDAVINSLESKLYTLYEKRRQTNKFICLLKAQIERKGIY